MENYEKLLKYHNLLHKRMELIGEKRSMTHPEVLQLEQSIQESLETIPPNLLVNETFFHEHSIECFTAIHLFLASELEKKYGEKLNALICPDCFKYMGFVKGAIPLKVVYCQECAEDHKKEIAKDAYYKDFLEDCIEEEYLDSLRKR